MYWGRGGGVSCHEMLCFQHGEAFRRRTLPGCEGSDVPTCKNGTFLGHRSNLGWMSRQDVVTNTHIGDSGTRVQDLWVNVECLSD